MLAKAVFRVVTHILAMVLHRFRLCLLGKCSLRPTNHGEKKIHSRDFHCLRQGLSSFSRFPPLSLIWRVRLIA
jgi:hypothetical protein